MLNLPKLFSIIILSAVISSCAHDADPLKMQVGQIPNADFGNYKNSIRLDGVSGGQKTSSVGKPRISDESFASALKSSLDSNGLLNEHSPKYLLTADITQINQPLVGQDINVIGKIAYTMRRADSNELIYKKIVSSRYVTGRQEAFYVAKMKNSNEGTIRQSIENFLNSLRSK
jgi:hypothetical protein